MHSVTGPHDCTMHGHGGTIMKCTISGCASPTTRKFTTARPFLHCGTSARLGFASLVCWGFASLVSNVAGSHRSMLSILQCTVGRTKLYTGRICYTVSNTHTTRFCEATVEWVMSGADLRIVYNLSGANFFRFGHCVNIGV